MVDLGAPKTREVALILPHEEALLHEQIEAFRVDQMRLADAREAAVAEGGDGWHDNAAFDAVNDELKVLQERVGPLVRVLRDYEVVPYPEVGSDIVAIGSRVRLQMNGAEFSLDIVGEALLRRTSDSDDLELATYQSPLAQIVLGHRPGDTCSGVLGGREVEATIVAVDQTAQRVAEDVSGH